MHMSVLVVTGELKPGVTGISFLVWELELLKTYDESPNLLINQERLQTSYLNVSLHKKNNIRAIVAVICTRKNL